MAKSELKDIKDSIDRLADVLEYYTAAVSDVLEKGTKVDWEDCPLYNKLTKKHVTIVDGCECKHPGDCRCK